MAEQRRHTRGISDATIPTRLVPPLIFSHFLLAAAMPDRVDRLRHHRQREPDLDLLRFLVIVAILGEMMFLRWRHSRREATPEARFPVPVVYAHGLFALITVVLVLLTALAIGGS
jgi:uncharacterized membrane protein YidH (DUF202 family)